MGPHKRDERSDRAPDPAWLAAYVDGELEDDERARVEAWLAHDPEARAEVEAQRRLKDLCDRCPAPEPDLLAWDDVLARVESALSTPAVAEAASVAPNRRRSLRWAVGAAAAAAAILLTLWLSRPGSPVDHADGTDGSDGEVFEV